MLELEAQMINFQVKVNDRLVANPLLHLLSYSGDFHLSPNTAYINLY